MNASRLDRRIQLQKLTFTKDSKGGKVKEFYTVAQDLPADVRTLSGREMVQAGQMTPDWDVLAVIRWRAGVTPEDRFIYHDIEHDILSVKELGRREGLELRAKARYTS